MDFTSKSLKSFVSDVTTVFTRAKQYAEETIGTAERTELDQQYESLAERADIYKQWTERIVAKLESVVTPNPNMRYGDMLIEKMGQTDIMKRDRLRNLEYLGNDMIDAGVAFGPGTLYGNALVKVGKTQQSLGQTEKEFVQNSYRTFIIPFRKFLEEDMKTIAKERKVLESKRLDLDAAKNRVRKARNLELHPNAERELKRAEDEFERQIEITKLLLEGLSSAQSNHVRCLNDFVTGQIEYYSQSYRHMLNLQRELSSASSSQPCRPLAESGSTNHNSGSAAAAEHCSEPTGNARLRNLLSESESDIIFDESHLSIRSPSDDMAGSSAFSHQLPAGKRRARSLNDYCAQNSSEMSLRSDEIIIVSHLPELDADWMIGERDGQRGKVPVAYLEILN